MIKGSNHTEGTKKKISESHKGIKQSEKSKRKIRKTLKGKMIGKKNGNWKGGKYIDYRGHIHILKPTHPYSNSKGSGRYIRESRLIAEKVLGRYLKPNEDVHHNNENPSDNRNSNLLICTHDYHTWLHHRMRAGKK